MSEERRKEIALALALRDGHQPEDIPDWRKTVYAQRADEVIAQEEGAEVDVTCPKCGDRGFTEQEHGLVRIFCDCGKGKELEAEVTGEAEDVPMSGSILISGTVADVIDVLGGTIEHSNDGEPFVSYKENVEHDSNSGTGQPDTDTGSGDTSQPQLTKKPKSKKKARKKSS